MNDFKTKLKYFAKNNQIGMALIISLLLYTTSVIVSPNSLNVNGVGSIITLTLILMIASAGQTLVIISDGIDMSVGATMTFTALIATSIMKSQENPILVIYALVVVLIVGALIGLLNGIGAAKIGLPPLIVTLSVSNVVTRLQYVYTGGKPTGRASAWFTDSITFRHFGFIPNGLIYGVVIFAIVYYLLRFTRYGQQLFLIGNNKRAAELTGIKSTKIKVMNYMFAGMLAGFAGLIGAGYMNFVSGGAFESYTIMSIVAVVVGGTILSGGKGSYVGTLAGALLMVVLSNSLAVLNLSQSVKDIIMGIVLIILLAAYNREKPVRQ
jgi:ribose transport system permease protein